ncbi:MAG: hypothetical protein JWP37_2562 [Mucilaginibacter sp.]|nr:hypothetical protein [Mucilaginibacter sp.]
MVILLFIASINHAIKNCTKVRIFKHIFKNPVIGGNVITLELQGFFEIFYGHILTVKFGIRIGTHPFAQVNIPAIFANLDI